MPTNIFNYTGTVQTFIVPHGVYSIQSTLIGANGGNSIYSTGGNSIKVSADIIVTPGTVIYIYIGGKGTDSNSNIYNVSDTLVGGFNGGGSGGRDNKIGQIANGAGGGGATDIRIGGTKLSNRIIIAGGGGGAGFMGDGGMTSEDGKQSNSNYSIGGKCGTQISGGTVINTRGSFNGILGNGGDATFSNAHGSGGGGGGYYGGAAGSSTEDHPNGYSAGGGGGSSYINKSYIKLGTDNIYDTHVTINASVTFTYIIESTFNEPIYNIGSELVDIKEKIGPIIISSILNLSSSQITILFDKNVSRKSDFSLPLTPDCFNLSILGGISTLSSVTPISITKLDKEYILDFLLIGIPNGDEVLQVNPVYDSIYDVDGNASSITQTNNTALIDVPKIIKVRISNSNSTISVIFNSTVYNTNKCTGILKTNNFSLSIHGGTALLNNTTPTKISVSGNIYTLGINIKGIPNGLEELIVNPSSNTSIYNKFGIPALVYQSNNSIHLCKKD
jgi:hypothetical protein